MITVSKYIAQYLERKKIKNIPIFQGGAIMNVLHQVGNSKKIKYFCPYHEQALSMEVDALSRLSGKAHVGLVTSGPGGTNLATGICCSFYDSIPSVYFTGQVGQIHITKKNTVRQRGFQETDIVSVFKPITKFATQLNSSKDIRYVLDKAFFNAENGRPGPCLIDIPFNIQREKINPKTLKRFIPKNQKFNFKSNFLEKNLIQKKKILVIAGGGVRLSNQISNFHKFIKKYNLPFVTTWPAQDICSHENKFFYGSIGRHAYKSANIIASEADLIITLGVRFSPKILTKDFAKKAKVIAVDIDKKELDHSLFKIDNKIETDLKFFFKKILKAKKSKYDNRNWVNFCNHIKNKYFISNNLKFRFDKKKYVDPYNFMEIFSKLANKKSIIVTDCGCTLCWTMQAFKVKFGQRLISAWGHSPMGYSVAAGIGSKIHNKKKTVFSIIGDGSFMINIQELQFIKKNKIDLKIIILDNNIFGNTYIGSKELFGNPSFGNDDKNGYYPPDIKVLAKTYHLKYFNLENNYKIYSTLKKFIKSKGTSIIHVKIPKNQNLIDLSKD